MPPVPPNQEITSQVAQAWPVESWTSVNVVVTVSGGPDSVALLRLLATQKDSLQGNGKILVAHYNHRWRGEASDADAQWVAELGQQLGLETVVGISPNSGIRSEEQLRTERRTFYHQVASQQGARYVATGHTASDQAETVLFRALRGSGLSGISGIAPFAQLTEATTLVRPLLSITRSEILAYLDSINQPWRHDATNEDQGPTRNWLRHDLLPRLEQRIPASDAALCRLANQANEANRVIQSLATQLLDEATREATRASGTTLNCSPFAKAFPIVGREALRLFWRQQQWPEQSMTAHHWQTLLTMATDGAVQPRVDFPGGVAVSHDGQHLVLARPENDS